MPPRAKRASAATKVKADLPATRGRARARKQPPKSVAVVESDPDPDIQILSDTTGRKLFASAEDSDAEGGNKTKKTSVAFKRGSAKAKKAEVAVKKEEDQVSAANLYDGKNLDEYDLDDSFIDDEASEADGEESEALEDDVGDALGEEVASEEEPASKAPKKTSAKAVTTKSKAVKKIESEDEVVSDEEPVVEPVKKVTKKLASKKVKATEKSKSEEELQSEEEPLDIRVSKYASPDWPDHLVEEPSTPVKTTRTLAALGSPNTTPSPKKPVRDSSGKKRDMSDTSEPEPEAAPAKKTRRGKEDVSAPKSRVLDALDKLPEMPMTPAKKRLQEYSKGPLTPTRRLARDFELLDVDDCYTDHLVSDWLRYEKLSPVKDMSVSLTTRTITFEQGVYQAWLNAPEKAKHLRNAVQLMTTTDWGSQGEYVNSGRVDLGELVMTKLRGNVTVRLASRHHPLQDGGQDTAFVSFGALCADSHLLAPASIVTGGGTYSKHVLLMPFHYDYHRLGHLLQALSGTCEEVDKELTFIAFDECITVSTYPTKNPDGEVNRSVSPSKARGVVQAKPSGVPGGTNKDKIKLAQSFSKKEMPRYMKDPFIATKSWIPVFDATKAFQGGNPDLRIDFSKISTQFPLYTHEVSDGDLVAVAHSIFLNFWDNQWRVQYGIYFVVLLAREHDANVVV